MNKSARYWLAGAFLAGFLAIGVPYWPIPYNKVSLPNTLYGTGLVVVGVAAAAARAFGKAHFLAAVFVAGAAIPAAVIARVAVETSRDPTSHNLWPLEVIIGSKSSFIHSVITDESSWKKLNKFLRSSLSFKCSHATKIRLR
jgi:multisubunit Na+/H+ antiporter MnhG subunit